MNKLVHEFEDSLFDRIRDGRVQVPAHVKETFEAGLDQVSANWANVSNALQNVSRTQLSATRAINTHALESFTKNLNASADAMRSLLQAETTAEAHKVQTTFLTDQWVRSMKQSQEFMDLATRACADMAAALTGVTSSARASK